MKTALRLIIMITGFYLLVDIFVDVSGRIPDSLRIIRRILKAVFWAGFYGYVLLIHKESKPKENIPS
ncbi:hypothetical protein [Caldibacillus debilis]|uniref:Uncharacterized protein n=1 Tax=Caldibacillus debilis TaxID=301148 RepID=A0A150MA44_9BACI|nr:hypothetical protein [Caldibacillus debilis]KYD21414.1 hypothetical protein B4135_1643 [Caldibacillus debilis]